MGFLGAKAAGHIVHDCTPITEHMAHGRRTCFVDIGLRAREKKAGPRRVRSMGVSGHTSQV